MKGRVLFNNGCPPQANEVPVDAQTVRTLAFDNAGSP